MLSNWHDSSGDIHRDARLTAYALGQLSDHECAEVELEIAESTSAGQVVKDTRTLFQALEEVEANAPRFEPSSKLRDAIEQHLDKREEATMKIRRDFDRNVQSPKGHWLTWIVAASILALLAPLAWDKFQAGQFRHAAGLVEFDGSADPVAARPTSELRENTEVVSSANSYAPGSTIATPLGSTVTPLTPSNAHVELPKRVQENAIHTAPIGQPAVSQPSTPAASYPAAPSPAPRYSNSLPQVASSAGNLNGVKTTAGPAPVAASGAAGIDWSPGVPANSYAALAPAGNYPANATSPLTSAPQNASAVPSVASNNRYGAVESDGVPAATQSATGCVAGESFQSPGSNTNGYDIALGSSYASSINGPLPPAQRYQGLLTEQTSGEGYAQITENEFRSPADRRYAKSTFSVDVDTASFANVRRWLNHRKAPPVDAVRIEELINYFEYDYRQPEGKDSFAVEMEVADCPWNEAHQLVRIGLKGREIPQGKRPPCNLVFLIDVSGSMDEPDKLPLLQQALKMLVGELDERDRVSIVTYAGEAGLKLNATSGDQHRRIRDAIDALSADGGTNGSAGIELAYDQAAKNFLHKGVNRIILATDGDLNLGVTDDGALLNLIRQKAASDVFLTVLGFGSGNLQDAKMELLADHGNGVYGYIDSLREARRVLVEQIAGSLVTIAKDVKVQVEFNPSHVASWRLIGYENRVMANRDFKNDKKDAGEIGAGHTVTALYELAPVAATEAGDKFAEGELKYQSFTAKQTPPAELTEAAGSGELLTLYLRYKEPNGDKSTEREYALKASVTDFAQASTEFRFASAVAAFGMLLRDSQHRGTASWRMVNEIAASALGRDSRGYRTEFLDLVRKAEALLSVSTPSTPPQAYPAPTYPMPVYPATVYPANPTVRR